MKVKGFGKKYFTLAAIQAYSSAIKLNAIFTICKTTLDKKLKISSSKDEDEPPKDLQELLTCALLSAKPCHCDCFFKRKTALAVKLFKFIPRCPYYTTYFAFRRTGVHPPRHF